MQRKKCRYCGKTWMQTGGLGFSFPHCEKEREALKKKANKKS